MRPELFYLFGLPIHSYGLMLAIAFFVGIVGLGRTVKRYDIPFDAIVDLGVWVLVGAIVGARLVYVITEIHSFIGRPWWEVFAVNSGGLAFHGGLIGGFLGGFWFVTKRKLPAWRLADLTAPFIALGYAIVRIGCLLNGCCYGKAASVPWALPCAAHDLTLRHPTQLYSMVGSLILFGILFALRNHKHFPGYLFLLYVGLYSIMRFIVEIFRESPMVEPWLSLAQLVCVILAVIAFGLIWFIEWRLRRKAAQDATTQVTG